MCGKSQSKAVGFREGGWWKLLPGTFERRFGAVCEEQNGSSPLPDDMRSRVRVNQGGTANVISSLWWDGIFLFPFPENMEQ